MTTWTSVRPSPPPTYPSSPATMGTSPHQVPFRTPHSVPQPCSFGFGASAGPAPSWLSMVKRPAAGAGTGITGASNSPTARRRRRSPSPNSAHFEEHMSDGDSPGIQKPAAASLRLVKKIKSQSPASHNAITSKSGSSTGSSSQHGPNDDVDLGKMLANLTKQELLSVFTRLMNANPSLKPTVLSLLPPPSFATFSSSLSSLESDLVKSLCGGGRSEYVWGRCRQALETYVVECRGWLSQFCPPGNVTTPVGSSEPEHLHPSTTFMVLETLTSSMRRVEACLPPSPHGSSSISAGSSSPNRHGAGCGGMFNLHDPFSSHLVPITLNAWHQLLTRLVSSHSSTGRVYSAETVRSWVKSLEGLVIPTPEEFGWSCGRRETQVHEEGGGGGGGGKESGRDEVVRDKMEGVRARWVNELGWMGGYKPVPLPHHHISASTGAATASVSAATST